MIFVAPYLLCYSLRSLCYLFCSGSVLHNSAAAFRLKESSSHTEAILHRVSLKRHSVRTHFGIAVSCTKPHSIVHHDLVNAEHAFMKSGLVFELEHEEQVPQIDKDELLDPTRRYVVPIFPRLVVSRGETCKATRSEPCPQ